MNCDLEGCKNTPMRAPRLRVCSRTPLIPGHMPIRMFTPYHFCEIHRGEVSAEQLLTSRVKAIFEECARKKRPIDFKCDFEPPSDLMPRLTGTSVEFVLVTTPEYRQFMAALGKSGIYGLARISAHEQVELQRKLGVRRIAA